MDLETLAAAIRENGDAQAAAVKELTDRLDDFEKKANRPLAGGGPAFGADAPDERKLIEALGEFAASGEFKAMAATPDTDGGYAMQEQLAAAIRHRVAQASPIRAIAQHIVLSDGDTYSEPVLTDGLNADWASEQGARAETTAPKMKLTSIPTHDLFANPAVTQRLLDNAKYDVGENLIRRIGKSFAVKEGDAMVSGNGVGRPKGILSYKDAAVTTDDDARAWGVLQYVVSGSAATIPDADGQANGLIDLAEKLAPEFRANARWLMNRKTAASVRKLKDADKNYIWANSVQMGQPAMLLGYPVTVADDMPDEAANAFPVAFGDFREGYAVVDAAQMRILRDPYSNKPYVHFYTVSRVGGDVLDFDAIKLLKCST